MFTHACDLWCRQRRTPHVAAMSTHRNLAVIDAAEQLAAAVNRLSDCTQPLLHRRQLLESVQSVSGNIAEGFGRATLPDRNNRLVIARGEAEETIKHLRANLNGKRITSADYWPLHNRAVTIVKMLNSLLAQHARRLRRRTARK